jgi:hypothetical protein
MDLEILEKANKLQEKIKRYDALLACKTDRYYWVKIHIDCANSNAETERESKIEREIFNKMLDIIQEERDKVAKELEEL